VRFHSWPSGLLAILLPLTAWSSPMIGMAQTAVEVEAETTRLGGAILDRMLESHARVMGVADRIRIAATPSCGKQVGAVLGIFTANEKTFRDLARNEFEFEEAVHRIATQRFRLGEQETVLLVVPGLPADLAGILPGDVITQVNGRPLSLRHRLHSLRVKQDREEIGLTIERNGEELAYSVEVAIGCAFPSQSWFGNSINAFATKFGKKTGTYVLYGMLDFLPSDDDLAIVLGHELAHLILDTGGTKRTEADADYLGLYLTARAGFEIAGAPELWNRMARENPYATVDWGFYAHPTSAARSSELAAIIEEIAGKLERAEPLDPEVKE